MGKWFTGRATSPEIGEEAPPAPEPDPVLLPVVTRAVHRALLALEGGDEPTAREWMWALFHADLRRAL